MIAAHTELPEPITLTYDTAKRKWVMLFDASAYGRSACHMNMWYLIFKGLATGKKDHKMEYGTAAHAALGHYYTHFRHGMNDADTSALRSVALSKAIAHFMDPEIEVPEDDYRSISHLIGMLGGYFTNYAADSLEVLSLDLPDKDGVVTRRPLVEQKFCLPFYLDDVLEVNLSGTIDFVGYNFDQLIIMDHKTTSATWAKGYLDDYELSPQLMMYAFIFRQLFPSLVDDYFGIGTMINGVFLRKAGNNVFQRSDVFNFTTEQVDAFVRQLTDTVHGIAAAFHEWLETGQPFSQNFTQCTAHFGCPYRKLCKAGAVDRAQIIEQQYVLRTYDPRTFQM